jgi:poly-gamma-glutamate capsule biosynthesis protein CapA/YwtB (metallophosphatase superfamily)
VVSRATRVTVVAFAFGLVLPSWSSAGEPAVGTRLTVAATGDFLIHSPVFRRALAYGGGRRYEFRPMLRAIRPVIAGADLALCHVETPFSYGPPRGYPSFRTPVALGAAIRAAGWDACSTASNHTLDAGQRGVDTTLDVLDRAGVRHAGSYRSRAAAGRPTLLQAKGVKVAFLAYTALTNGQPIPHPWTLNLARARRIIGDARRARRAGADAVIVNLHWGAEFRAAPTRAQRSLADALTRSRFVTAVVGQHVHVVQPIRWIHGKPVVFGEGNLLSNQTGACCPAASQDGLIALLDLRAGRSGVRAVRVRYLPIYVRHPDFTVVRARGRSRARTIGVAGRSRHVVPIR